MTEGERRDPGQTARVRCTITGRHAPGYRFPAGLGFSFCAQDEILWAGSSCASCESTLYLGVGD